MKFDVILAVLLLYDAIRLNSTGSDSAS